MPTAAQVAGGAARPVCAAAPPPCGPQSPIWLLALLPLAPHPLAPFLFGVPLESHILSLAGRLPVGHGGAHPYQVPRHVRLAVMPLLERDAVVVAQLCTGYHRHWAGGRDSPIPIRGLPLRGQLGAVHRGLCPDWNDIPAPDRGDVRYSPCPQYPQGQALPPNPHPTPGADLHVQHHMGLPRVWRGLHAAGVHPHVARCH
mmetsp:Transcript_23465/g.42314  ORF Transcript_23465/g.42314 Transcript_23465/m.42314 type:complete len:200 (-) Transcript_23465:371-970(-)